MTKRARSSDIPEAGPPTSKKFRPRKENTYTKIATRHNAELADKNTPLSELNEILKSKSTIYSNKGEAIVYWMRIEDMRGIYNFSTYFFKSLFLFSYDKSSTTELLAKRLQRPGIVLFHL